MFDLECFSSPQVQDLAKVAYLKAHVRPGAYLRDWRTSLIPHIHLLHLLHANHLQNLQTQDRRLQNFRPAHLVHRKSRPTLQHNFSIRH